MMLLARASPADIEPLTDLSVLGALLHIVVDLCQAPPGLVVAAAAEVSEAVAVETVDVAAAAAAAEISRSQSHEERESLGKTPLGNQL